MALVKSETSLPVNGSPVWVNLCHNLTVNLKRLLNCTTLSQNDYPIKIELEARGAACYVKQGASTVALAATNGRLKKDERVIIDVNSASEAYIAVQRESADDAGTLIGMRIDRLL